MKTALVVEDDPFIRSFLEDGLGEQGYCVVSARSSGEALNILGSGVHPVDVLVADIRLGDGLDGWEIARCAREIEPNLPILYVTGGSSAERGCEGVSHSRLIQKPFTLATLALALSSLS
jgi:CheY-like chemotaxis protein